MVAKQESRYIELIERLLKLSSDKWPIFQKYLRNIYNERSGNKERPQAREAEPESRLGLPAKNKSQKSPIRPPRPMEDALKAKVISSVDVPVDKSSEPNQIQKKKLPFSNRRC